MTNDWPYDEVVHFSALGLVQPTARAMWSLPYGVNDVVEELAPETGMTNADWREHIVIPFYRDVLVPSLPMTVEATYAETGLSRSPVTLVAVDGKVVPEHHRLDAALVTRLSNPTYRVDLPAVFLAEVLLGAESIRSLAGVSMPVLSLAFEAGMRPTEIRAQQAAGTLDPQALSLMAGLRV